MFFATDGDGRPYDDVWGIGEADDSEIDIEGCGITLA